MKSAIIILALLVSGPAMAQVALHGDAANYSPGPRNVDPGPWHKPDAVVQEYYDAIGLNKKSAHCSDNGGPEYPCHICYRGTNAMTLTGYECSAAEEARQERARR